MQRRATAIALASALYAVAVAAVHDAPRIAPSALAQSVARPFVLPSLWRRLVDASRRSDPGEAIAAGRLIAQLLPDWTDGLVHVAWICALDLSREAPNPGAALDRLETGVGWLAASAEERAGREPRVAAELLLAAATLVEARADADPELAAAFRTRLDRDPSDVAHEYIGRALRLAPDPAIRDRHAFSTLRLAVGALRMGDVARAQETLDIAARLLAALPDPQAKAAADAIRRLRPLPSYLADPDTIGPLLDDPWLRDLGLALEELRDG